MDKDGRTAILAPAEFIRRFLMHTLPRGYTKIRHFGLLAAGNVNSKLVRARDLLEAADPETATDLDSNRKLADARIEQLLAENAAPLVCPCCGIGRMIRSRVPAGTLPGLAARRDTS